MKKLLTVLILLFASAAWGGYYEDGVAADGKKNHTEAMRLFKLAAAQGHVRAQYELGDRYFGHGIPQGYAEAANWYKLAAAQGHAKAQSSLGMMYRKGNGVVQNLVEAVKWFKLSAAQGDVSGQYRLVSMHANGHGVVQDYVRAHMWMNLAAASGGEDAAEQRDHYAISMTQQQIAQAQKMARECQARNFKNYD